jgi:hypothetical protein
MPTTENARREFLQRLATGAAALPVAAVAAQPLFGKPVPGLDRPKDPAAAPLSQYAFDVRDFGAVGDGKTLCTRAIQAAVDACAKADGGKVIVPPGRFLTGPIFLRSNLEFEVLAGGTLLGSANFEDYPTMAGRWEGLDRTIFASLLTGDGLENVSITGRGVLDGQGAAWWDAHHKTADMRKNLGLTDREPQNPPGAPLKWPRPRMINLYRSRNVLIRGLSIVNSPSWNVHPVLCEDVCIEGLSIVNPGQFAEHRRHCPGLVQECPHFRLLCEHGRRLHRHQVWLQTDSSPPVCSVREYRRFELRVWFGPLRGGRGQ